MRPRAPRTLSASARNALSTSMSPSTSAGAIGPDAIDAPTAARSATDHDGAARASTASTSRASIARRRRSASGSSAGAVRAQPSGADARCTIHAAAGARSGGVGHAAPTRREAKRCTGDTGPPVQQAPVHVARRGSDVRPRPRSRKGMGHRRHGGARRASWRGAGGSSATAGVSTARAGAVRGAVAQRSTPSARSRNAHRSAVSSISLEVGFPAPWPAFTSTRMSAGASPPCAAWSAAANLNECAGTTRSS